MSDNAHADKACALLTHYIGMIADAAGIPWDNENAYEVRDIVDSLLAAVDDAIRAHTENEPHIYADGSTS